MAADREPVESRVARDLLRIAFAAAIVGLPLAAALLPTLGGDAGSTDSSSGMTPSGWGLVSAKVGPTVARWLEVALRVLLFASAQGATVGMLRLLVPRPAAGAHRVGLDRGYARFVVSESLVGVALHPIVRTPFWLLHVTRNLYLKLLGARLGWRVSTPEDLTLRDPSLIEVGRGSQIEPGVVVESSLHRVGRVRVDKVIIGDGCLIGAHSILMPGATIGHQVRLEPATLIGEDVRVGVGVCIGEGVRLERGVDLGSYASVGPGSTLLEGVRVGDRAKIGPGSFVEPNTQIGEREHWVGAPARRVIPADG